MLFYDIPQMKSSSQQFLEFTKDEMNEWMNDPKTIENHLKQWSGG